jgi:hypothetical protein
VSTFQDANQDGKAEQVDVQFDGANVIDGDLLVQASNDGYHTGKRLLQRDTGTLISTQLIEVGTPGAPWNECVPAGNCRTPCDPYKAIRQKHAINSPLWKESA